MPQLPVVKYIDHLMIEVNADAKTFSQFVSLWTELFGLPLAFPLTPLVRETQLVFKSLGLFAGNVYLELYQLVATSPEPPLPTAFTQTARLYGVAFEPQHEDLARSLWELHERQIPTLPPLPVSSGENGTSVNQWTMVFMGDFLGSDLTQARTMRQDQFLSGLQTVFSRGLFFLNQFSPMSYEQARVLRPQQLRLRERFAANPLGLVGLREIVVGATNVEAARKPMQRLFAPRETEGEHADVWHFEDGPAIRLVADEQDHLATLVFQVQSLEQAKNVLCKHGLLDRRRDDASHHMLMVDTIALLGLDIHLTELSRGHVLGWGTKTLDKNVPTG